jgi:hypothetical protein
MKQYSRRSPWLVLLTVAFTVAARGADLDWIPIRPDTSAVAWQFLGCHDGAIGYGCWTGAIPGRICQWQRVSERGPLRREELYSTEGNFEAATETLLQNNETYGIVFFDRGRSYYRTSDLAVGRQQNRFTLDVVIQGRELARYASSWDPFWILPEGVPAHLPMDTHLVSGRPFAAVQDERSRSDERAIKHLRSRGVDRRRPFAVEFGFWFDAQHQPEAARELASLGCHWLTAAERHGKIGPFPAHCAMAVGLDVKELRGWHERFTALAVKHSGRYYGWTYDEPR